MPFNFNPFGLLGKIKDSVLGKGAVTTLFDKLKSDPSNKEHTDAIKKAFVERPLDVVTEMLRRIGEFKKEKTPEQNLFVNFRQTWENSIHKERVQPLKLYKPTTKAELIKIVKDAEKDGLLVRAVGTGHSFSDVSNATDVLVNMLGINKKLELEKNTFRKDQPLLYNCEAGMMVDKLNADLDTLGLALPTMAAFDKETIYGAIATSTHGTGIRVKGMSAMVQSMDIIASGGICYRVEPLNGITDPVKFKTRYPANEIILIQDDDKFYSAVVGFGLMGIVYSLVIAPIKTFYLMQKLWVSTWDKIKPKLQDRSFFTDTDEAGKPVAKDPVSGEPLPTRAQVFVNPYRTKNFLTQKEGNTCVVQVQLLLTETEYQAFKKQVDGKPKKKLLGFIGELLSNGNKGVHEASISGEDKETIIEEISPDALLELLNCFPTLTPMFLDLSMIALLSGSGKFGKSFIVMNQGKLAIKDAGYSVEPGFPVDTKNTFINGAEEIIRIATLSETALSYITSPMCLRFVKESDEYLSPEYKTNTCMIDVPMMLGTIGDDQMMDRMQLDLIALGARPHWGKICNLVNGRELIHKMYPKFDAFLNTVNFFNPKGTFNSSFSYRSGISEMKYKR